MNLVVYILLISLSFKLVALFINDKDCGKVSYILHMIFIISVYI